MKALDKAFLFCLALFLVACTESGPRETLDQMARAMEENNAQFFMNQIDMPLYTSNYIKNLTDNDTALNSLNTLGDMLGLGSLDNLIGSIVDFRAFVSRNFNRGIATGELMAQCKVATTPDCPWYPSSLREAKIIELDSQCAIASVTTPARLTSWLALAKIGPDWKVIGAAAMENTAREMAQAAKNSAAPATDGKAAQKDSSPVNI